MKRRIYAILTLLLTLGVAAYFYLQKDYQRSPPTLYINGHIITMDEQQPLAEAMFVKDGKIRAIGKHQFVQKLATNAEKTIDLKGATLMPGFIDPHTHFSLSLFMSKMHDLSGFKHQSNEEVWAYFEEAVAKTPANEWVVCKGIDPVLVSDLVPPSIQYLDKTAPDNPVLIFSQSLHSYWVNTKAFELLGITKNTPAPSEDSYYAKDENGELNGLIVEQQAILPFFDAIRKDVLSPSVLSEAAAQVMENYAKNGNTTIVSTGITIRDKKPLLLFEHLSQEQSTLLNNLLVKIGMLPERKPYPRHFIYMRHDMAHLMPETKKKSDDFYDIIGIKHWYDGAPYIGSMYLNAPYMESELTNQKLSIPVGHKGKALITKEELTNFIKKYHNNGWQIAIHSQGDASSVEILDVFDRLNSEGLDLSSARHRLEHCLLLPELELDRMKRLHITPSFHINHLYYYGDALRSGLLGEERAAKILPVAAAENRGIKFSLHADQPMFESHPFRLIQTAVERTTKAGNLIGEEQKISLISALKAMTIDAAWQIHKEDQIGSLKQGKYADFIILDQNPFEIPTSELENIRCLRTFVNGNEVR